MFGIIKVRVIYSFIVISFLANTSCKSESSETSDLIGKVEITTEVIKPKVVLSKEFNDFWYNGEAEITTYKLEQARYGEIRDGKAVLVFVTEDFLPEIQVKADNYKASNISVLKLNATKNFNTGIYPYSIMQSTFYPVSNNKHALKVSSSMQEWCGHVYMQLNNKDDFEVVSHSYFQGEADQNIKLKKAITENELWTQLRIDPKSLPTGEIQVIPSLEYIHLRHKNIKAYNANATMQDGKYVLSYPDLNRILSIKFSSNFPYQILGWEESITSGFGAKSKTMTTKATMLESIKSAYWSKNSNADETLRERLKLQ